MRLTFILFALQMCQVIPLKILNELESSVVPLNKSVPDLYIHSKPQRQIGKLEKNPGDLTRELGRDRLSKKRVREVINHLYYHRTPTLKVENMIAFYFQHILLSIIVGYLIVTVWVAVEEKIFCDVKTVEGDGLKKNFSYSQTEREKY